MSVCLINRAWLSKTMILLGTIRLLIHGATEISLSIILITGFELLL